MVSFCTKLGISDLDSAVSSKGTTEKMQSPLYKDNVLSGDAEEERAKSCLSCYKL